MFLRNAVGSLMLLGVILLTVLVIREAFAVWPNERMRILPFVSAGLVRFYVILIGGLALTMLTVVVFFGGTGVFVEHAQKSWSSWFLWTAIVTVAFLANAGLAATWQGWLARFGSTDQGVSAIFPVTGQYMLNAGFGAFTFVWWWVATAFRLFRPALPTLG